MFIYNNELTIIMMICNIQATISLISFFDVNICDKLRFQKKQRNIHTFQKNTKFDLLDT